MEGFRHIAVPIVGRAVIPIAVIAGLLFLAGQPRIGLALLAGALIGFGYSFHVALGFERLAKRRKGQLPFVVFESILRVLIVGAAPVLIVGRGPLIGYLAYFVGFVATFAVAFLAMRNVMNVDNCAISR